MKFNPQIHHRKTIRLKGYDYSQAGAYFITICCANRECLFGEIVNGEMILNECGTIAYNEWLKTPEIRPQTELDVFVIMPNHIHGIIIINDTRRGVLNTPIDGKGELHSPVDENEQGVCNTPDDEKQGVCNTPLPLRSPSQTVGAIVRGYKSSITKWFRNNTDIETVWQRNYHEHVIRNEQSYQTISNYIVNNPASWKEDKFFC